MKNSIELLYNSNRGVYIPKLFAQEIDRQYLIGIDHTLLDELADSDPYETEFYWELWDQVLNECSIKFDDQYWKLWQDGDLFAYNESKMTEQEKQEFFGEY